MEDVLEQVVGDIWDETDTVEDEVTKKSESEYEIDGDMPISDFLDLMDILIHEIDIVEICFIQCRIIREQDT